MSSTFVVFGASSGIGLATVTRMACRMNVIAASRRGITPGLDDQTVRAVRCDVRDYTEVCALLKTVSGDVQAVINCAGVGAYAPLDEKMPEYWREIVETNLLGCAHVISATQRLAPSCRHLVMIGSLAGSRPSATVGNDVYAAAKAGVARMVEDFRLRLRQTNNTMKVSLIVPGFVEGTDFGRTYFRSREDKRCDIFANFPSL